MAGASGRPGEKCHRERAKQVETIFGPITLRRNYFYCEQTGERRAPLDEAQGLVNGYSPSLVRLSCRAAARTGFENASQDLAALANIHVDGRQIQRLVNLTAPRAAKVCADIKDAKDAKAEPIPVLYVEVDGTGVPMVGAKLEGRKGKQPDGSAKTRNRKLGCVFTQDRWDEEGHPVRDYQSTTYVGSFETAQEFGGRIRSEALPPGNGPGRASCFSWRRGCVGMGIGPGELSRCNPDTRGGRSCDFFLVHSWGNRQVVRFSTIMHFLQETDFSTAQTRAVFNSAEKFKRLRSTERPAVLAGQTWAMIFAKSSTRTRVSFEVGIHELGGNPLFLSKNDIQLGRGETIADTARVLSRYVHGLIVRTFDQAELEELAQWGTVPVVNALTDLLHPCQIYADAFTMAERWAQGGDLLDSLRGRKVAFLGDAGCNMANSWLVGANHFGMQVSVCGPNGYGPGSTVQNILAKHGWAGRYQYTTDPREAVAGADVVYTDVWVSMGKEAESADRLKAMAPYQVTASLMRLAKPDAYFMHCLPAYAGKEVSAEVLESPQSIVFDQAENRMHVQKAILAELAQAPR